MIKENETITYSDDERFDNDMMLMTGELSKMLADLVEALGGEAKALNRRSREGGIQVPASDT